MNLIDAGQTNEKITWLLWKDAGFFELDPTFFIELI